MSQILPEHTSLFCGACRLPLVGPAVVASGWVRGIEGLLICQRCAESQKLLTTTPAPIPGDFLSGSTMRVAARRDARVAALNSSSVTMPNWQVPFRCQVCGSLDETFASGGNSVSVYYGTPPNRKHYNYCLKCTHWNPDTKSFQSPEYWIRQSVPFSPETPNGIVADWLEEQNKLGAANFLRGLCSGG